MVAQSVQTRKKSLTNTETLFQQWSVIDYKRSVKDTRENKNVFLGSTRLVTKVNSQERPNAESAKTTTYYYHADHLGSAQLVTNHEGVEYERIEYTPYGETWIEKSLTDNNIDSLYKFTGKELDEETGLYYFGARYLDPKTSRWLSTDPALAEYIPQAGSDNSELPGMGGIYNQVNFHLYHYAGNNPVKYVDPDGRMTTEFDMPQTESDHYDITISIYRDPKSYDVSRDRNNPTNMALDTLIAKNNKTGEEIRIDNVQSVANYPETGGGENNHPDYMDDTVVGYFDFIPGATTTVATGPAAIIANAKTRGGYTIGPDGISSSKLSPGKHYVHSTGNPTGPDYSTKNSKGCIILTVEDTEYLFNTLEAWGVDSNTNIRGVIVEKKY